MKYLTSLVTLIVFTLAMAVPNVSFAQSGKGYLGINSQKVQHKIVEKYKLPVDHGAYVTGVVEGSAAEDAGIEEKDVITKVGDESIYDDDDLTSAVRATKPYTETQVELYRKGEKKVLNVKMGKLRSFTTSSSSWSSLDWLGNSFSHWRNNNDHPTGVKAQDLTRQLGEYMGVPDGRGALLTQIHRGGVVEKAGFKAGDVVTKVDGHSIDDVADLLDTIHDLDGKEVSVDIVRDKKPMSLTIKLPHDDEDWY